MIFRPLLFGTAALLAATLVTTPASADELDASSVPQAPPSVSAPDPSGPHFESGTRTDNRVPSEPGRGGPSKSVGIDLKIDGNGFRLGGRLSGSKGVSEAWLNGQVRGDGATLDGRFQGHDGPARDFKLNLDLLPGWVGTAARLWRLLP